jgi:CRP-like cAMP-binding protein
MVELKEFLIRTPFFGGLPDASLDRVMGMLVERSVPAGAEVFREGDAGRSMYIVHAGEMIATQTGGTGHTVRLIRYGKGDFFGEMTLIEMQPRAFTVSAESDAMLWELTNMDLYALYRQDVKAYVLILQNVNRELCRRLRGAGNRITEFADEAEDERTQIRK